MLVPRVVQLRTHQQQQQQHSHSSPGLIPPRSPAVPARHLLSPMASPAVDQLVADFLRKRGFTKALKAFVAEASYKEPKVSLSVDLGTICSEFFSSKKDVGERAWSDTTLANGSILKPVVKTVTKQRPESSSDDSDDSSDESDDEEKELAPAPVSKKIASVVEVHATKAKAESSSSDDSSSDEEDVKPGQTGLKINGVEKKETETAASESSSSDSDDEEEAAATTSKAEVPVVSKKEESSSDDSDDESGDEEVVAKAPPPALSKGKKSVVAAVVPKTTPKPASSSSSDSSSDDEEVGVEQNRGQAVEPVKPADDSSSEEDSDVEMKSVTPAVADKKTAKPSSSSDSSDSSDDEMEVDTKPAISVKEAQKSTLPKVEAKKATSSSSDSSSDDDSDDEASDIAKNTINAAVAKPTVVKKAAPSSSSDSSSDEEEGPKSGAKSEGAKNITSAKNVADDESDSSDESVEIKSTAGRSTAAVNGKQVSLNSSDSSDSSDDEANLVAKPSGKKAVTSMSKPSQVVKDKKSRVTKKKQVTPELTVEKSKVKRDKKGSQKIVPRAEDAQMVENEVVVAPVNKKRKADDKEADAGRVSKKANVDGIAIATATDNDLSKSAQKRKQGSATKGTPSAARAFQRVKVEEVELLDERLADNSYWAKAGAEEGWGAKAEEVLSRVRGKGFRHEKTKKKRGSYKGGIIDNASHSIKFQNSDEE